MSRTEAPLTGPYWAAVDHSELVRPVCERCGRSHFSPQVMCPWCQSASWSYQPSSGRGVVVSHTTIHRPPDPAFEPPYAVADVEVDEGWRLLAWIVECDPADVSIGMDVEVRFVPGVDGNLLPAFAPGPAEEDGAAGSGSVGDGRGRGRGPDQAEEDGAAGPHPGKRQ